jgi:hypothetical protein
MDYDGFAVAGVFDTGLMGWEVDNRAIRDIDAAVAFDVPFPAE